MNKVRIEFYIVKINIKNTQNLNNCIKSDWKIFDESVIYFRNSCKIFKNWQLPGIWYDDEVGL